MRIEKSIRLQAEPAAVWEALTNPALTKQYFHDCEAISDWQVGSGLRFSMVGEGHERVYAEGVILASEPAKFLQHTCYAVGCEDKPSEHTTVTYTLTAADGSTDLAVSQGELPDDADYDEHAASWDQVLGGLKTLVEG